MERLKYFCIAVKKKSCPTTYHAGPKGESRYSSYSFLTLALNGGEWAASRPSHALPLGKDTWHQLNRRLGGPQSWSGQTLEEKSSAGDQTPLIQSVVTHYILNFPFPLFLFNILRCITCQWYVMQSATNVYE
jgi:hypothetical protein